MGRGAGGEDGLGQGPRKWTSFCYRKIPSWGVRGGEQQAGRGVEGRAGAQVSVASGAEADRAAPQTPVTPSHKGRKELLLHLVLE